MAEVVNLNKVRKTLKKVQEKQKAEANRVLFGLPKSVKQKVKRDAERQGGQLDQKKID